MLKEATNTYRQTEKSEPKFKSSARYSIKSSENTILSFYAQKIAPKSTYGENLWQREKQVR